MYQCSMFKRQSAFMVFILSFTLGFYRVNQFLSLLITYMLTLPFNLCFPQSVGPHCCDVCQSRFPTAKLLERHTKKHYVVHRCLLCDYDSLELWSAVGHCRSKHSGDSTGSIHCPQCNTIFRYAGTPLECQ